MTSTLDVPVAERTASLLADALLERRTLRRLVDEVTGLVAGAREGDRDRAALLARHLETVTGMLVDHELSITRAGLRVARRDAGAAEHVDRLRAMRGDLGVQLARVRLAVPYWVRGGSAVCRDTVWEVLLDLGRVIDALFATEERGILPLVVPGDLPPSPATGEWIGHLLETLTPEAGDAWLRRRLSPLDRARWILRGRPRFVRARRRLLG